MTNKLDDFRKEMLDEIRNESMINFSDPTSEFLNYYTDKLITSEEILEFEEYDIEVVGKNRRKAKVDGYMYDSLERSLSLFIADFNNSDTMTTLTNTMIDSCYNKVINYLDFVYSGYIENNCEESSVASQLASEIIELDKSINKIKIFILSDSVLSKFVKDISMEDFRDKKVELNIWDINRIYNLIKSFLKKENLDIDLEQFEINEIPCIKAVEDKKYVSYLAVVDGSLLGDLYIKYGPRLLEGNVRSFLSVRGKINKGIRNTIRNEPEIFFVYNNGIACTATNANIVQTSNGLKIKSLSNFQIINGGQTTASIANAILQDKAEKQVNKIKVPMKLTIIKKDSFNELKDVNDSEKDLYKDLSIEQKQDKFVNDLTSNIAKYANSQNKVDESDFFSNHPFHIRFEELSRKVYAPPVNGLPYETIWFYERAKGQYTQEQMKLTKSEKTRFDKLYPKKQMIKKIDLAKFLMTYYQMPHIVSKGNQYNMRVFATIIEKDWKKDKDKTSFNVFYYKKCISLGILFKRCEQIVSHLSWYQEIKAYRANIVTYSLAYLFYAIEKEYPNLELDFLKIWNEQSLYEELEDQLEKLTYCVFKFITSDDRVTLNVTEWCKKEACWQRAQNMNWQLDKDFVNTLINKQENNSKMLNEKKEQKENDEIQTQVSVINFGESYWKKALSWGMKMKLLNETDISFLKSATNFSKHIPSDKQCKRILEIHSLLIEEGFK